MSGREDRVPPVTLDLEDMRLRYDTYQVVATQPRMRRQSDDPQCAVPQRTIMYQHRGTLLEDSVQRSWTATFFRIFVFFLYPEKYGGSKTVLKSEIGLVDHIQKK